jgi:pentatricopeptide repeat protein
MSYNSLHIALQHIQTVLDSPVCSVPGSKEALLNVLFEFKFDSVQLEWLFAKMVQSKLDVSDAFLGMMRVYAAGGKVTQAETIYNQMKAQGLETSTEHLLALAQGFAVLGDIVQTKKYVGLLPQERDVQQRGLKYLVQCFAERGLQSDAIQAYREYRRNGFPTSSFLYEQMIKASISTLDTKGVLKFFHKSNGFKSMGMYTQLVKGLLAANSSVTAWKTVREALVEHTDRNRTRRVHVPAELAHALIGDIKGKHIDYLKDRIRLVNLPLEHTTQLLSKMIYYAPTDLAQILYSQFGKGICERTDTPVHATLNYMNVLAEGNESKMVQELFDQVIDISFSREIDLYTVLLKSKQSPEEIKAVYDDLVKNGLSVNGDMIESLLKGLDASLVTKLVTRDKIPIRKGVLETDLIPLTF